MAPACRRYVSPAVPSMPQIYKALKSIIAAALLTHIDPQTGTNPFFEGINYTPGNKVVETGLGPEQPVAAIEEVLASATVDIAELVAKGFDVQVSRPVRHDTF